MLGYIVSFPSSTGMLVSIGQVAVPFINDLKQMIYVAVGIAFGVFLVKIITIVGISGLFGFASGGWAGLNRSRSRTPKYITRKDVYVHYEKPNINYTPQMKDYTHSYDSEDSDPRQ